jgi:ATP-dependent Clp endopeptidase proteolytic subunit ClpP
MPPNTIQHPNRQQPVAYEFLDGPNSNTKTLLITDAIGKYYDWETDQERGESFDALARDLVGKYNKYNIEVMIHSPGGSVYDGLAIYSALLELRKIGRQVTTSVYGYAASIASVIVMAGNPIRIAESASIMLHQASGTAYGTAADLQGQADRLTQINQQMAEIYAAVSRNNGVNKTADDYLAMFAEGDTWLTAQQAMEYGLANEIFAYQDYDRQMVAQMVSPRINTGPLRQAVPLPTHKRLVPPIQPVNANPPAQQAPTHTTTRMQYNIPEVVAQHLGITPYATPDAITAAIEARITSQAANAANKAQADLLDKLIATGKLAVRQGLDADYQALKTTSPSAAIAMLESTAPRIEAVDHTAELQQKPAGNAPNPVHAQVLSQFPAACHGKSPKEILLMPEAVSALLELQVQDPTLYNQIFAA